MQRLNEYIKSEQSDELIEEGLFSNLKVFGKVIGKLFNDASSKVGKAAKKLSTKIGKEWDAAKAEVEKAEQGNDAKAYKEKVDSQLKLINDSDALDDKEKAALKVAIYLEAKAYAVDKKNDELKKWADEQLAEEKKKFPDVTKEVASETADDLKANGVDQNGNDQTEQVVAPDDEIAKNVTDELPNIETPEVTDLVNKMLGESLVNTYLFEGEGKYKALIKAIKDDDNKRKAFITLASGLLSFTRAIGKQNTDLPNITNAIFQMIKKIDADTLKNLGKDVKGSSEQQNAQA